jgi:hypothetical protein
MSRPPQTRRCGIDCALGVSGWDSCDCASRLDGAVCTAHRINPVAPAQSGAGAHALQDAARPRSSGRTRPAPLRFNARPSGIAAKEREEHKDRAGLPPLCVPCVLLWPGPGRRVRGFRSSRVPPAPCPSVHSVRSVARTQSRVRATDDTDGRKAGNRSRVSVWPPGQDAARPRPSGRTRQALLRFNARLLGIAAKERKEHKDRAGLPPLCVLCVLLWPGPGRRVRGFRSSRVPPAPCPSVHSVRSVARTQSRVRATDDTHGRKAGNRSRVSVWPPGQDAARPRPSGRTRPAPLRFNARLSGIAAKERKERREELATALCVLCVLCGLIASGTWTITARESSDPRSQKAATNAG